MISIQPNIHSSDWIAFTFTNCWLTSKFASEFMYTHKRFVFSLNNRSFSAKKNLKAVNIQKTFFNYLNLVIFYRNCTQSNDLYHTGTKGVKSGWPIFLRTVFKIRLIFVNELFFVSFELGQRKFPCKFNWPLLSCLACLRMTYMRAFERHEVIRIIIWMWKFVANP